MTLATPSVYIGTQLMDGHALADMPVLAGLTFNWGNDDQIDFEDPGTLSAQLLIRTPSNTDFLAKGAPFGIMIAGTTVWAGRIATLKASPDKRKKDALLVSLTAADTLADLAAYRTTVDWYTAGDTAYTRNAAYRRGQLAAALPAGWTYENTHTLYDWTTVRSQRWNQEPYLNMLDMHLRSTVARRHVTTRYVPGAGLAPRLTITAERAKSAPAETLTANPEWSMTTAAPANSGFVKLTGGMVDREIEWEKTPDDTVTDVQLSSVGVEFGWSEEAQAVVPGEKSKASDTWDYHGSNAGNPGIDFGAIAAMQAKYGFSQAEFDIDSIGGYPNSGDTHISYIVNYWLEADAQWRPTGVHVPDSRKLPDATALALLDVAKRYKAYATVDGLPANNPAGGSRVRAYVVAGEATWTGKKWRFDLTFGRVPRAPANGGFYDFNRIATHADPDISDGTAETIGTNLSFADFAYIGA